MLLTTDPVTQSSMWRTARILPTQVLDRLNISIEEQLYSQALYLLTQCLTPGAGGPRPASIPSSDILALMATISIHPSMTTRTTSSEKRGAADQALQYLELLSQQVDPATAILRDAFQFNGMHRSRSGRSIARSMKHDRQDGADLLRSAYSQSESLRENADDVWSIVGWAFNCSVRYHHRWERWRPFLSLLVGTMERDLSYALGSSSEPDVSCAAQRNGQSIPDTLIFTYLAHPENGRQQKRRIMRAVLADGSQSSMAEFGEIWKSETLSPQKKMQRARGDVELDLDNDKYADYDDSSDEDVLATSESMELDEASRHSKAPDSGQAGQPEDVTVTSLRQRLLSLLLTFCHAAPEVFLDLDELLDLYAGSLRSLPLRQFQQLLFLPTPVLDDSIRISLDQILLRTLIDTNAPVYYKSSLTQEDFETHFAPFPANLHSILDNAKTSLLVEDLLRMLWKSDDLRSSQALRAAVVKGVEQRNQRARFDARKKDPEKSREERESRQELRLSAERMLCLLDMLQ